MLTRSAVISIVVGAGSLLFVSGSAQATIGLPDSESCSSTTQCLAISNTNSGTGIIGTGSTAGVHGFASTGAGVDGKSDSGDGVKGFSGGIGVLGLSDNGNGVVGQNGRTDFNAAAISALSGDAQSGLAYWGTGGIQITSSLALKAGTGSWSNPSDARIKRDVNPLKWGLAELRAVRPVTFKYNGLAGTTDDGHEYVGVIAQELEKILPDMVSVHKAKLRPTDANETDIKVVDPSSFTFVLINAVKQQQETIERQERRIASLERSHRSALSASVLGGGTGTGLFLGLLPLAFVILRKRKQAKSES